MANYLVRVGLPDRPGALGAVASRIGAVGGDVVSIDILQRDGGEVVDELGVVLAGADLVSLLRDEILEVDGVTVESMRSVDGPLPDRHAEILEYATDLFRQPEPEDALRYLTTRARRSLCGSFAAVLEPGGGAVAVAGEAPGSAELAALVPDPERPDPGWPGRGWPGPGCSWWSADPTWSSATASGCGCPPWPSWPTTAGRSSPPRTAPPPAEPAQITDTGAQRASQLRRPAIGVCR